MGLPQKAMLLHTVEEKLSTEITASDMTKVMGILSACLDTYELEQKQNADVPTDDVFQAYIAAMQVQGRSPKTIERYRYVIERMLDAVHVTSRQVTVYHLRKYLADEKARGISDRTLESTRQVFSSYFNWLQREGLIPDSPTANLGAIKCVKKIKDVYSDIEFEKLKIGCGNHRDRAIISFLMSTGCRISEMTALNIGDIDFVHLECKVFGKGAKERTVYMDPVTGMLLRTYLDSREDDNEALFVSDRLPAERLQPNGVRLMLKRLEDRTGVAHVHPHKFRRTLATGLIRHGMPIQEVAAILGHDKLDTTMQYIVMDKTDISNAYRKYA